LRYLFLGLGIALVICLVMSESPTRRVLVVKGCSPEDAKWQKLPFGEFPGNQSQWDSEEDLIWNTSGRVLLLLSVDYRSSLADKKPKNWKFQLDTGLSKLPIRPHFLMTSAPPGLQVQQSVGSTPLDQLLRWQLTCR